MIEMLNILEPFDLKAKGRDVRRGASTSRSKRCGAPIWIARAISATPTSSRCRSTKLLSKDHAKQLAAAIDPVKASSSARAGQRHRHDAQTQEPDETTHFSVIDRDGMAVSNTFTLEGGFGSRVVVKGAGFLLNNEMGDFNKNPGVTDARRDDRHAGQPDRSRQADAELDDVRRSSRRTGKVVLDHRIARRPHHHQHRALASC